MNAYLKTVVLLSCVALPRCAPQPAPAPPPGASSTGKSAVAGALATSPYRGGRIDFVRDIKPIFELRCINCHNSKVLSGRMSLENRDAAFQAGPSGRFIVPGDPDASVLFQNVVAHKSRENAMPPVGVGILPHERDLIYAWIKEGAEWPGGRAGRIKPTAIPLE